MRSSWTMAASSAMTQARAPAYLDTARGRLGLVAATSTFRPWNRAGTQRPDMQGRPGINPLAFKASYQVDAKAMDELRRVSRLLGFEKQAQRDAGHFYSDKELKVGAAQVKLAGVTFTQGEEFSIIRELETKDLEENLRWMLIAAEARIEVWRSQEASKRSEIKMTM